MRTFLSDLGLEQATQSRTQSMLVTTPTREARPQQMPMSRTMRSIPNAARICPSLWEEAIAGFLRTHPQQRRPFLRWHPILAQVARARVEDMARRHYYAHVSPDVIGPNWLAEQAGYKLPSHYSHARNGNNIESLAANYSPQAAWDAWMYSPPHRRHLLGLETFYAEQVDFAVGHCADHATAGRHLWVVITARPGP